MERQEKGNMDTFGSSIRHRTGVPKAQSPSDTDSVKINATSLARPLQPTQTEADNATARQSGSSSNIVLHLDTVSLIIGVKFNINMSQGDNHMFFI